jgi:hypothetical protein
MDWGLAAGVGLGLLGQNAASGAAKDAAAAQLESAKIAADAAAFKPYSVTTGLGTGYFNPETQTAGYTLDPALQAWRDQYMTSAAQAMPSSFDTTANAQQYYNEMQAMMQPSRQAENLAMQQDLFGSGRLGMRMAGEGAGAGSGMVQPDVFGLNQARAQADQALAQQARAQAMTELDQSIARGTGMLQTGLGIEQMGLTPLELGGTFGGYGSSAGAQQAQALLSGGLGAAQANLAAGLGTSNMMGQLGLGLMQYNK